MKKFIPILSILATSCLFTGCANMNIANNKTISDNVNYFKETISEYENVKNSQINTNFRNYNVALKYPENATLVNNEAEIKTLEETYDETYNSDSEQEIEEDNQIEQPILDKQENLNSIDDTNLNQSMEEDSKDIKTDEISTLYYLSKDIEGSCDEFCQLKEKIVDAIVETENLINKVKNNEIELTREQRLFINEQSNQLKNITRELTRATNELSFNLSDMSALMRANNQNIDELSLKYLIVLDNLVNGNEMLQNGLTSLNMMNNLFNSSINIPSNNKGRILYGFQQNNEQPIIKDYYIDESGELVENKITNQENSTIDNSNNENQTTKEVSNENKEKEETKKTNIDTYKNNNLKTNIDTYGNNFKNTDTFFNTALLDNEFMYGTGGYGAGFNGYQNNGAYGYNPYINQYKNYEQSNENNSTNGVNNNNSTQNIENNKKTKNKKRFKFKNNIDTYKDEKAPTLKAKVNNIKKKFSKIVNFNSKNY